MSQALDAWLGREEERIDWATAAPLRRLAAVLDHEVPPWREGELPPLAHWLFHLSDARQSELGPDGHPRRGGFMPPITLPRRMWAGSRVSFRRSIPTGTEMLRRSTVTKIESKSSESGELVLVTIRHRIHCLGAVAIEEEQDIVYLGVRKTGPRVQTAAELPAPQAARRCVATPELLFRFSALTFNSHRIHYDRDYARDEEHYPGLVVQGPLLATLLMDHYLRQHPAQQVANFSFRARAPVFEREPFDLCLAPLPGGARLWVAGADGTVRMTAQIEVGSGRAG